jgi:hypothetical protein
MNGTMGCFVNKEVLLPGKEWSDLASAPVHLVAYPAGLPWTKKRASLDSRTSYALFAQALVGDAQVARPS